ncbi:MAG: site-specific integrase [Candidatus Cloacimonetes bacterium]|jgi:integrase/recombinase XerD|nr:site-specific integrase [Candidatus Cloacimonadota bacterium]
MTSSDLFFSFVYEFLNIYLPNIMCRSTNTISSYVDTLSLFRRYVKEQGKGVNDFLFSECTRDFVYGFSRFLMDNGNKPSTVRIRLAGLKSYISFCASKDISIQSVSLWASTVKSPSSEKLEKRTLSPEQVVLMLKCFPNTELGYRNKVVLIMLYETAMRVSELISLKVGNLIFTSATPAVFIKGKGKKERYVPLSQDTSKIVATYIAKVHGSNPDSDVFLFFTNHHDSRCMISTRAIQLMLDKVASKASSIDPSFPKNIYPHMLRRSKATTMFQNGTPIYLVSAILGHSKLETTKIYAKPSLEMLASELVKCEHPDNRSLKPVWCGKEEEMAKKMGLR